MILGYVELNRLVMILGVLIGACVLALVGHYVLFMILQRFAKRSGNGIGDALLGRTRGPMRYLLVVAGLRIVLPSVGVPEHIAELVQHILSLVFIGVVSWLLVRMIYALEDFVVQRYQVGEKDNLQARKVQTQFNILKRILIVFVAVLALGTMLMTFEQVRQLGTSILASAGVVGLVIGIGAQRTIGNLIAGIQIAITQPFRIDDVVIVENEWGRIEEITLTYVVVRIWDLRRLVLPITYFIEKPFQNWTRKTADILGTVYIYVDYTADVEKVREELKRILDGSELWDRKVCVLQVTNTSERTLELRALMSAVDASTAWSLRCEVREKLIAFIRKNYPQSLPRVRADVAGIESLGAGQK